MKGTVLAIQHRILISLVCMTFRRRKATQGLSRCSSTADAPLAFVHCPSSLSILLFRKPSHLCLRPAITTFFAIMKTAQEWRLQVMALSHPRVRGFRSKEQGSHFRFRFILARQTSHLKTTWTRPPLNLVFFKVLTSLMSVAVAAH